MFALIKPKDVWITKHAADKMVIEGITIQQICDAVEQGSRFNQTDGYLSVYTYFSVAWKRAGPWYKLKTVYLNK